MRRQRKTALVLEQKSKNHKGQIDLLFIDENEPVKSWEYAVLVSNADYLRGSSPDELGSATKAPLAKYVAFIKKADIKAE